MLFWLEMMSFNLELLLKVLIATALGGVVGMEREYASRRREGSIFAGARTLPLIGLLGCLSGFLNVKYPGILFLSALAFLGFYALRFFKLQSGTEKGMTTEIASLVVFFNGVVVWEGYFFLATAFTILITLILSLKPEIRGLLRHVDRREIFTFLQFLILGGILLPILPDQLIDPFGALNPRKLGYVVVVVSGLSYLGYILGRWRGARRSILIVSIIGGLISSTALTWDFSLKSRRYPELLSSYASGMVLASAIMFFRIAVLLVFLSIDIFYTVALWLVLIGLGGGSLALWQLWRQSRTPGPTTPIAVQNPLNLLSAIQFAILIGAIVWLGKVILDLHGLGGLQLLTAASAIVNVDAIVVSIAEYFSNGYVALRIAASLVFLALGVNSISKWLVAWLRGGWRFARAASIPVTAMALAALMGWYLFR